MIIKNNSINTMSVSEIDKITPKYVNSTLGAITEIKIFIKNGNTVVTVKLQKSPTSFSTYVMTISNANSKHDEFGVKFLNYSNIKFNKIYSVSSVFTQDGHLQVPKFNLIGQHVTNLTIRTMNKNPYVEYTGGYVEFVFGLARKKAFAFKMYTSLCKYDCYGHHWIPHNVIFNVYENDGNDDTKHHKIVI